MTRAAPIALALALAVPLGCSREAPQPPPSPPAANALPAPIVVPAAALVDAGAPSHPKMCEVEISGTVKLPKQFSKASAPLTFAAIGDCLAPTPTIAGFGGTTNGRYFIEVFVPWGSDVSLCAASESKPYGPSTLYGKAAIAMHADKAGEIEFHDVEITLAKGPPKTFAHGILKP